MSAQNYPHPETLLALLQAWEERCLAAEARIRELEADRLIARGEA